MVLTERLSHFTAWDIAALALLIIASIVIGYIIENDFKNMKSVGTLMADYRREWMVHMVTREPRVFDAQILAMIRQATAFFASASMIAIGGCLALLGNTDRLMGIAQDLTLESDPIIVWELKVLVILSFLANAFFKFVWSNRLFGYCGVLMGAVPNDPADPRAKTRAEKAGEINITASRSFNRGLRSVYFALAACAWLLGAGALIIATATTCLVLFRREFASRSKDILMRPECDRSDTQT
ncbi:DUF599 domain-containing protein [Roseovarius aestuarii]|uniref:DUF599 domain-containing protein n=1 Tax=Roseovarius aestuarii TaxID=475083 RepID=A0A1X7BMU5_9RHOB|nr:DUF599 domain-containing protein [Roseovarius aestuarii]SMC10921.1 hypothetical protein ROA7745_00729 [Roseovarius aestuarii]